MRYNVILVMAVFMLLFFFVPAVNGISVTTSQGNSNSGTSISMTYGSAKLDTVDQHIKSNPSTGELDNSWYFTGPGATSRTVHGPDGSHVIVGFSVSGPYAQTWYGFASSSYPYASESESLTSRYAYEIYATGYAFSSKGSIASGYIDVYSPYNNAYLSNFWNNVLATSSIAQVKQSAASAGANTYYGRIQMDLWARNRNGDYDEVYAKQNGYPVLTSYPLYSDWYPTAYANSITGQTYAIQSFSGYGWPIYTSEYAKKYGWSTISRSQYNYGSHGLGQLANASPTYQSVQYPHFV